MKSGPPRIVSLFPAATEMACAIGLGDRLVGVSHECNWPPEVVRLPRLTRSRIDSAAGSAAIDAQVKSLAASGQPLYELDGERLAQLRPGLIIAQSNCDVCAVSLDAVTAAVADSLALEHAKVLALNPRSLAEVLIDVERVGAAAGQPAPAGACAEELRRRVEEVRRTVATRKTATGSRLAPRVVVIEWIEPLMVAGNWAPELVALAGGEYGLARAGEASRYAAWQDLCEYSPEVVVVAPCGFDLERSRREARALEQLPGWTALPAVRSGHVYVVDGDAYFNRPGPRLVESLQWLSALLTAALLAAPTS